MYLTARKKFNRELAFKTFQELQPVIRELINQAPSVGEIIKPDGTVIPVNFTSIPLDLLLEDKDKEKILEISQSFIKGYQLESKVTQEFVYGKIIDFLVSNDYCLNDNVRNQTVFSFFEALIKIINEEASKEKIVLFSVIGASLKRGDVCSIGPVEFINPQDFIENQNYLLDIFKNNILDNADQSVGWQKHIDSFLNCDLIAKVTVKNRDINKAKITADEIIKRVYTVVALVMPMVDNEYSFFGTVGEKYLDSISSFAFVINSNDEKNLTGIILNNTNNYILNRDINLLDTISIVQNSDIPEGILLSRIESITSKFLNGNLTDFEERIWIAIYWFREAIFEKELNPKIIKYATMLEALFNSKEGGISEQIAEFTAHVVGVNKTSDKRIDIYNHTKKLYDMRSKAVHGDYLHRIIDDRFLAETQWICKSALFIEAYYSGEDYYQTSDGYNKFVQYILKKYRFL